MYNIDQLHIPCQPTLYPSLQALSLSDEEEEEEEDDLSDQDSSDDDYGATTTTSTSKRTKRATRVNTTGKMDTK